MPTCASCNGANCRECLDCTMALGSTCCSSQYCNSLADTLAICCTSCEVYVIAAAVDDILSPCSLVIDAKHHQRLSLQQLGFHFCHGCCIMLDIMREHGTEGAHGLPNPCFDIDQEYSSPIKGCLFGHHDLT